MGCLQGTRMQWDQGSNTLTAAGSHQFTCRDYRMQMGRIDNMQDAMTYQGNPSEHLQNLQRTPLDFVKSQRWWSSNTSGVSDLHLREKPAIAYGDELAERQNAWPANTGNLYIFPASGMKTSQMCTIWESSKSW